MSDQPSSSLWIPNTSPLFFYSPDPVYFQGTGYDASWTGILGPAGAEGTGGAGNDTMRTVSGGIGSKGAVILPSIYATSFMPVFEQLGGVTLGYQTTIQTNATSSSQPVSSGQNVTLGDFTLQTMTLFFDCGSSSVGSSASVGGWAGTSSQSSGSSGSSKRTTATPTTPSCGAGFRGAWIETEWGPPGATLDQVILDDASPLITNSGFTPLSAASSSISSTSSNPQSSGAVSASGVSGVSAAIGAAGVAGVSGVSADSSMDYAGTLSMTGTSGASASVSFKGASILITGVTGPTTGTYTITLDGSEVATLNSHNDVVSHGVIMFFQTNLDTSQVHTISLTATDQSDGGGTARSVGLVVDKWMIYGPKGDTGFIGTQGGTMTTIGPSATSHAQASDNTTSTATATGQAISGTTGGSPNVGVIVGSILGAIAGVCLLLWFFRRTFPKMKFPNNTPNKWDTANMLENQKNEEVHITTAANQRYYYPGGVANSQLKGW